MGDLSTPLYLFTYSIVYIGMDSWRFILWVIIRYCFIYFVDQVSQLWYLRTLSAGSRVTLTYPHYSFIHHLLIHIHSFILACPYFLEVQDAPGILCIISCAHLRTSHFLRNPGSYHWRMILETKIWGLGAFYYFDPQKLVETCFIVQNKCMLHVHLRTMCILLLLKGVFYKSQVKGLIMFFKSFICLLISSINSINYLDRKVLESPTTVILSILRVFILPFLFCFVLCFVIRLHT